VLELIGELKKKKNRMELNKTLRQHNLPMGRMLSYSKSEYRMANPKSVCYFNANIVTAREGKVWYGDLDLTKDALALKTIAEEHNEIIYVLKELDCRFEDEGKDGTELITKAVWDTTQPCPSND
jgi:hypothetical protein